jgi:hypothetical protein
VNLKKSTNLVCLVDIERELKNNRYGTILKKELRNKFKDISLYDFKNILNYLKLNNFIYIGDKEITWIKNDSKRLNQILSDSKKEGRSL